MQLKSSRLSVQLLDVRLPVMCLCLLTMTAIYISVTGCDNEQDDETDISEDEFTTRTVTQNNIDIKRFKVAGNRQDAIDKIVDGSPLASSSRHNSSNPAPIVADDVVQTPLFATKPLVIWSSNFHPTPVHDLMTFLEPFGVRFINKDLSSKYCQHFNTCSTGDVLRVINSDNVLPLTDYEQLIPRFYAEYKDDPEMKTVDAFLCCDPPSVCELYAPFNRSVIVVATTRYNIGRSGRARWKQWNELLVQFASEPWNVVGANNRYDVEYMKYFTGINTLQLLPSMCVYTRTTYTQNRSGYLLWMRPRDPKFFSFFLRELGNECRNHNITVELTQVRQLYDNYKFTDLAAHQGIVHLPYQVSIMALLEQYRMNIPLFLPAKELLIKWHKRRFILHEKSESPPAQPNWEREPLFLSNIKPHPSQRRRPDPNSDVKRSSLNYWLQFADYYTLPHIVYFNDTLHLAKLLSTMTSAQLWQISRKMSNYNRQEKIDVRTRWKNNLLEIAKHSEHYPH